MKKSQETYIETICANSFCNITEFRGQKNELKYSISSHTTCLPNFSIDVTGTYDGMSHFFTY